MINPKDLLFRIWDKENKIMSEPFSLHWLIRGDGEDLMFGPDASLPWRDVQLFYMDFEWMRATGLNDKHGNMIFEGDIVKRKRFSLRTF
jgi:hypothetical protein